MVKSSKIRIYHNPIKRRASSDRSFTIMRVVHGGSSEYGGEKLTPFNRIRADVKGSYADQGFRIVKNKDSE